LGGTNPIDPHVSKADPLFVNGGNGTAGYKLQQTSSIIDNAKVITGAPTKDFFGTPVPTGSGVDRGACEYVTTVPVKLGMFRGENINGVNKLTWNTFTEINNSFFVIEKSINGVEFSGIGKVYSNAVNGNANFPLNYNFIDEKPFEKVSYYRLKQVDKNGDFIYSTTVKIETKTSKNISLEIYPNPITNNDITFNCIGFDKGFYEVSIINSLGQVVVNKKVELNTEKITLTNLKLSKGSYYLTIKNSNVDITKSIIVQ
jgi:hypothetical protein